MTYDVYTPSRQFRLAGEVSFRTYTWEQFLDLASSVPELEIVAVHDFRYDLNATIELDAAAEDAVLVFRKR